MSVSIKKAFQDVFSDKYNKTNIVSFILIISILQILYIYFCSGKQYLLYGIFAYLLMMVLSNGYSALTSNAEINLKDNVFPSIFDIGKILFTGIKFTSGLIILNAIVFTLLFLLFSVLNFLNVYICHELNWGIDILGIITYAIILVLVIIGVWFLVRYMIPLILNFFQKLEMNSFINFSNTKRFLDERKGNYAAYIFKSILIMLMGLGIAIIIAVFIGITGTLAHLPQMTINTIIKIISRIMGCGFTVIFLPNINAQFINSVTTTNYNNEADEEALE